MIGVNLSKSLDRSNLIIKFERQHPAAHLTPMLGRSRNMRIAEVPVEWNEIEGSKLKFMSMIKMGFDLIQIAVYHRVGLWTIKMKADAPIELLGSPT